MLRAGAAGLGALVAAACAPAASRGASAPRPARRPPARDGLARDLGEILWIGVPHPTLGSATRRALARGGVGGVVLFRRNLVAPALAPAPPDAAVAPTAVAPTAADTVVPTLAALTDALHAASGEGGSPVLVAIDQEGGRVQTLRAPATSWPAMARLGELAARDPAAAIAAATELGAALGRELAAVGIDVNLAPVLDLAPLPGAPPGAIGDRALSGDPALVAALGAALARGLASAGLVPVGKHFPGHGRASADTHFAPARSAPTRAALADELAPFAAALPALPALMTAHVRFLGSDLPGTLDPAIATDLLRGELGFTGALLSDNLEMNAVAGGFSVEDAATRALAAGCDALLLCHRGDSFPRAHAALGAALRRSAPLRRRLAEAADRVRALKAGRAAALAAHPRPSLDTVGAPAHQALAARLAGAAPVAPAGPAARPAGPTAAPHAVP